VDLNQLYHDHQLSLMRAIRTHCDRGRALHRGNASRIARMIERIHRASGATALRNWEAPYTSQGDPPGSHHATAH
jgi:hypothetical protein